ncbi:MAG: Non-specific serine/threonine protein kinase [Bacteroidota bacterium]|jgi:tetratricopeptide (TPR) repeat protein|nr:Non-specific serine/threonine protein kinase [Bacteroidota bacterium]
MKKLFFLTTFALISFISPAQEIARSREEEAIIALEKGKAMESNGDWKNALQQFNLVVGYDPKNAEGYYHRALAFQNLKDYRAAINDYSRAISLNSSDGNAFYGRGMCLFEIGRKKDACIDLSKASGLGNGDASTVMMNYCN